MKALEALGYLAVGVGLPVVLWTSAQRSDPRPQRRTPLSRPSLLPDFDNDIAEEVWLLRHPEVKLIPWIVLGSLTAYAWRAGVIEAVFNQDPNSPPSGRL